MRTRRVLTLGTVCAALTLACEGETPPEEQPYPEATSPAAALKLVEISFNQRDLGLLKAKLSTTFVFYFDPSDVGQNPPGKPNYTIPESWDYTNFWVAAGDMFTQAYSINLSIPTGGVGFPGPGETTYKAENLSLSLLVMIDELNGYIANQGYCDFVFESYTSEEGKRYWRLASWRDFTSPGYDAFPGVSPASFGRILAVYH